MRVLLAAVMACSVSFSSLTADERPRWKRPGSRHPVDAVRFGGELFVLNDRSATLSRIDLTAGLVTSEDPVGEQPVSMSLIRERDVAVVDFARHELLRITLTEQGPKFTGVRPCVRWPVSVVTTGTGELAVAGLWSRRLQILPGQNDAPTGFGEGTTIPLPFNPRGLLPITVNHLLVIDGFSGQLAIVDVPRRAVVAIRSIHGHNIRGWALDPEGSNVYLAHQMLDERAATTHDNVSLGILLSNLVRKIPVDALFDNRRSLETVSSRYFLGRTLEGAADPNGLAFDGSGRLWVALGGTSELCEVSADGIEIRRHPVKARPTRVLAIPEEGQEPGKVIALETLADGVAVFNATTGESRSIPLGPDRPLSRAERGERLFYDGRLSLESWMSCQSCHPDGHTHGLLADTAGDGGFGNPKRTLSLLGTRDANPWAWNGQFRELTEQVHKSVTSSMQGPSIPLEQTVDIVTFLHTLASAPPVDEPTDEADQAQIERGRVLFGNLGCARCHIPPLTYTKDEVFDVGLHDERGQTKFNPPTLRGVSQRDRLFHDNRAASLEAVFDEFGHQLSRPLEQGQRADLLRFLRSL